MGEEHAPPLAVLGKRENSREKDLIDLRQRQLVTSTHSDGNQRHVKAQVAGDHSQGLI